jgi:peptide/nickel transport system permease protein
MAAVSVSPEAADVLVTGSLGGRRAWPHTPLRLAVRRFVGQPAGTFGLFILLACVLLAVAAPFLAPYGAAEQFPGNELAPPSIRFPLGTDNLGRDVLSRIIFGTRVSLLVGVIAVAVGAGLGASSGLLAGYHGGWVDAVLMRVWDAIFAVPAILLGIVLAAAFGASATIAAITLGIATTPTFARIARAAVLAERRKEYVQAARTLGATHARVLRFHILPNVLGPLFVQVALTMSAAVLLEAGLSFLGLGVQAPQPSWGGMLSESRQFLRQAPWYGVVPGISLTLVVLALNSVSDALRDALDPRTNC